MRKVCREYAAIFDEIEENPSCVIQWNLAQNAGISKPQFIPLDRIHCLQSDAAKSEEPVKSDLRLSVEQHCSDEELQLASSRLNSTRTNSELPSTNEPAISLQLQQSHTDSMCQGSDLPGVLVEQQENELKPDACSVDNCQNFADVSADCASGDKHDSATVVSHKALPETSQTPTTGVPGSLL